MERGKSICYSEEQEMERREEGDVGVVDVDGRRKPNAPIYARLIR